MTTPLPQLNEAHASTFANAALAHVRREYPNKLDHIMSGPVDVQSPKALHPVFYGSFDWHSCVHGYWLLARVIRRYPELQQAHQIRALFDYQFTTERIEVERAYAAHPSRKTFERPYGWAWLLMLAGEFAQHDSDDGRRWSGMLTPLAQVFEMRFLEFLPRATYPIRVGTHFNTAFALTLAMEYATVVNAVELRELCRSTATRWYSGDRDCQAWEPSGDDFLSSALMEAECMRRMLGGRFVEWFDQFVPRIHRSEPATLFTPAFVSDRSDGKIAHLDGLNLSRAWCWRGIASELPSGDARRSLIVDAAIEHLDAALPHVTGDYMGEHWLATFALLALDG
jgi:hypothetical protein